ncbi:unnamed protein product, partial [Onchocerca flexuosa]|uniref:DNA_mis_repair domain-containing protein n=1 Tax=Onchocerca flexuosa TaxID=387005 RepID=A0A183HJ19_9BILA
MIKSIDVNVSPDKRSVFFEREKQLFALLRASLLATFAPHLGHVDISNQSTNTNDISHLESMNDSFIHLTQPDDNNDSFDVSTQNLDSSSESKNNSPPSTNSFVRDKLRGPSIDLMNIKETTEKTRKRPASNNCSEKSTSVQKRPAANLFEKFAFKVIPHSSNEVTTDSSSNNDTSLESSSVVDQREKVDFRETSLRTVMAGASKDENNVIMPQEDADFPDLSEDDDDDVLLTAAKDDQ